MPDRATALKALITGKLPVVKEVQVVGIRKRQINKIIEKTKGRLASPYSTYQDKIPHPDVMPDLDDLNADPDVDSAITNLTELVASGFYTEMPEGTPKTLGPDGKELPHPNKAKFDAWAEKHHFDEYVKMAVREAFEKGFFAMDFDPDNDYDPKVLPSDSMYMWRKVTEKVAYKYTQEFSSSVVETWGSSELERVIWWAHKETPMNPYGRALAYCLQDFIDARRDMTDDANAVLHRLGYPLRRWESQSKTVMDNVLAAVEAKAPEEDLFLDNLKEGDLRCITEDIKNVRVNFEGFQQSNDQRITNNLNAPTMSTLHNSTEASATKMLEFFENYAQGIQHSLKRLIENKVIAKIVGAKPYPNLVWGKPKTGLEKLTGADIGSLKTSGCITYLQAQDLLKKLGVPLIDDAQPQTAPNTQVPFANMPQLDPTRMQTLNTSLEVIEQNYRAGKITLIDAYREAAKSIKAHVEAAKLDVLNRMKQTNPTALFSPESESYWQTLMFDLGAGFRERILPTGTHKHDDEPDKDVKKYVVTVPK